MKINMKSSKIKEKVCETCGLKESCGDLPGICLVFQYIPIILVIIMLLYLLVT